MVQIIRPEDCIGCKDCELSCPDFAIYVAEKSEYKFAKLTEDAKARAAAIKANNFREPGQ
jgi:2-oxoglutarate ferredoxin oxidoreductase subunit delta